MLRNAGRHKHAHFCRGLFLRAGGTAREYRETDRQRVRERQRKKMNGRKMVSVLPLPLRNVQLLS